MKKIPVRSQPQANSLENPISKTKIKTKSQKKTGGVVQALRVPA
jgi:hypothetical protein